MKSSALIAIICLCSSLSYGRIGETLSQCTVRYGDPDTGFFAALRDPINKTFHKAGVTISIHFFEDKADMITFSDIPKPAEEAIQSLLRANGGDHKWEPVAMRDNVRHWKTDDGSLLASSRDNSTELIIWTKAHDDRDQAAENARRSTKDAETKKQVDAIKTGF